MYDFPVIRVISTDISLRIDSVMSSSRAIPIVFGAFTAEPSSFQILFPKTGTKRESNTPRATVSENSYGIPDCQAVLALGTRKWISRTDRWEIPKTMAPAAAA